MKSRREPWWRTMEWSDAVLIAVAGLLLVLLLMLGLGVSHPIRME